MQAARPLNLIVDREREQTRQAKLEAVKRQAISWFIFLVVNAFRWSQGEMNSFKGGTHSTILSLFQQQS